ncbi:MAG: GNAT family N-acetyltransferase [Bacteroidales bacterium]|nr:MAG: GNAT family N-acetyltransferase [Bacteroidales bacterium]
MDSISIRDFESVDFEGLIDLWLLTGLGSAQRGDNLEIIEQSISMGGKMLMVKNSNGKIVGTSWMTFDGRRIHLHHFGIHPDYQRKGIGQMLAIESLKFVKQKGYQVKLEVHKDNYAAIELYRKLGFAYLGDYDVYIIRDLGIIEG